MSYQDETWNIQPDTSELGSRPSVRGTFRLGHTQARLVASEIAARADAEIARLKAERAELARLVWNARPLSSVETPEGMRWALDARAALAKIQPEPEPADWEAAKARVLARYPTAWADYVGDKEEWAIFDAPTSMHQISQWFETGEQAAWIDAANQLES